MEPDFALTGSVWLRQGSLLYVMAYGGVQAQSVPPPLTRHELTTVVSVIHITDGLLLLS